MENSASIIGKRAYNTTDVDVNDDGALEDLR